MNDDIAYAVGRDIVRARDRKTVSKRRPRWWQKVRYVGYVEHDWNWFSDDSTHDKDYRQKL